MYWMAISRKSLSIRIYVFKKGKDDKMHKPKLGGRKREQLFRSSRIFRNARDIYIFSIRKEFKLNPT